MKKILALTDFSKTADNALKFALETAKAFSADVAVLHSFQVMDTTFYDFWELSPEYMVDLQKGLKDKLDRLTEDFRKEYREIKVETMVSSLPLVEAIRDVNADDDFDLIVMGKTGATGIREKIWGGHTTAVMRDTALPMMIIPHHYEWKKPDKVVFLSNKFEKDEKILNTIFEMAGLFLSEVQVSVFSDAIKDKLATYSTSNAAIHEYEDYLKEKYHDNSLTAVHLMGEGFEESMEGYIQDNKVDMLVMVTYQRGFWKRLFNPSLSNKVSYQTKIPLLVIPGGEK